MRALIASVLLVVGCSPPAPRFLQVDAPGDTRDGFGTYRVTALVRGATDRVQAEVLLPDEEVRVTTLSDQGDGRFVGEIEGLRPGARVELLVRAEGPGGEAEWPPGEPHRFRIFDASGVCLVDGDCLAGEMCDRLEERCVERDLTCADAGDCPLDYECDVPRGECRFRRSTCTADAECGRGRICEDGLCVARPECLEDAECPAGSSCLVPPGRCVSDAECADDSQCPGDQRCEGGRCVEVNDCPEGCPPGNECVAGRCVDNRPCGECPPGQFCSELLLECVECTADGHCGSDATCVDRTCVPGPRGAPCTPCGPDGACGVGYGCNFDFGGICAPRCVDGRCPEGTFCDGDLCLSENLCGGFECRSDNDCEGPCRAGICDPVQLCSADAECTAGWLCDDGVCLPDARACSSPFDCASGEICIGGRCRAHEVLGECRPCAEPADCPSPALCADVDGTGSRCLSICGVDGCAEGLECVDTLYLGICLPNQGFCGPVECGDDPFEGVEGFPLPPNERLRGFVCAGDVDIFRVPADGQLILLADGPLLYEIVAPDGRVILRDDLEGGENAELGVARGSLVRILTDNPVDVGYVISLIGGAPPECDDDILEENDRQAAATIIGDGADINPTACAGDEDWYRIRMEVGQQVTLIVSVFGRTDPGLNFQVRTSGGAVLREGQINEGAAQVELRGGDEATYVRVFCEGCDGVRYNIQTRFGEGGVCPDDMLEPNQSVDQASDVAVPTELELFVCDGDDDFFRFTIPARARWRIDLTFRHGEGDIDTELFEGDELIDASTSGTDNERIDLPISRRERTYVLRVFLFPSTPLNGYRLRIRER